MTNPTNGPALRTVNALGVMGARYATLKAALCGVQDRITLDKRDSVPPVFIVKDGAFVAMVSIDGTRLLTAEQGAYHAKAMAECFGVRF